MNNKGLANPSTSGNSVSNIVLERIHRVIGNLVRTYNINKTYVHRNNPWLVIFTTAVFAVFSTENRLEDYSPDKLIFVRDIIFPVNKQWIINEYFSKSMHKFIHMSSTKIVKELNTTDKFEYNNLKARDKSYAQ